MKIGKDGAGRLRPEVPGSKPGKAGEAGKAGKAGKAKQVFRAPDSPTPLPAEACTGKGRKGSAAMERLRQLAGAVPRDTDAAALDMVKGLLRAELGAGVAEQPGFENLAASVAEKIKQDPLLGEKLRKVLGDLARP